MAFISICAKQTPYDGLIQLQYYILINDDRKVASHNSLVCLFAFIYGYVCVWLIKGRFTPQTLILPIRQLRPLPPDVKGNRERAKLQLPGQTNKLKRAQTNSTASNLSSV